MLVEGRSVNGAAGEMDVHNAPASRWWVHNPAWGRD